MLTTDKIAKSFGVGSHGSTYGGNPLACAVAEAVLDIVAAPETLRGVTERHRMFFDGLNRLNAKHNVFKDIRGDGLLIGCELQPAYEGRGKDIVKAAEVEGLLLLIAGPSVMRLAPSLLITPADIAEGMARFDAALAKFVSAVEATKQTAAESGIAKAA
jgi:acetylornithine/N-succinyldiaminopimelate aminotransferase